MSAAEGQNDCYAAKLEVYSSCYGFAQFIGDRRPDEYTDRPKDVIKVVPLLGFNLSFPDRSSRGLHLFGDFSQPLINDLVSALFPMPSGHA